MPCSNHQSHRDRSHQPRWSDPGKWGKDWYLTLVQGFGSALNLNIHLHMLVLDGVYTTRQSGRPRFHPVPQPHQAQLQALLNRLIQRVVRRLEQDGLLIADPAQPWLDLDFNEPMDSVTAASIRYRIAIGPHSGRRARQ